MSSSIAEPLTELQRRQIFKALVQAQDQGMPVSQSRQTISAQFGISVLELLQIEDQGIEEQWPPL